MGTVVTKMAMRTRYDVLRYSRTTWVICACVLLQKDNQPRNQSRSTHQIKSRSRNLTSRNRWSEHSSSWSPSPGRLNIKNRSSEMSKSTRHRFYQGRVVLDPRTGRKRKGAGVPGGACFWVSSGTNPPPWRKGSAGGAARNG